MYTVQQCVLELYFSDQFIKITPEIYSKWTLSVRIVRVCAKKKRNFLIDGERNHSEYECVSMYTICVYITMVRTNDT